jgi:hypothetical protein
MLVGSLTITDADVSAILDALRTIFPRERRAGGGNGHLYPCRKVNYFLGCKRTAIGWTADGDLAEGYGYGKFHHRTYRPYGLIAPGSRLDIQ